MIDCVPEDTDVSRWEQLPWSFRGEEVDEGGVKSSVFLK